MSFLPPVIATLIADTKEYTAKMTEAQGKMSMLGKESMTTSEKMTAFGKTATTAVAGVGLALGAYAVDQAYKFQESLDKIKNQAGLTTAQTDSLGKSIQNISNATGVANSQLAQAALLIEQAGVKGSAATNLLNASAKAAVITNASVVDTTKAIVSAQTLQISKGMDVAKLTGILVKGSQDFVGGLSAEEQVLSGRVAVALAKYGIGLKQIIPLGAEFAKVGLQNRSITAFANSLTNLNKPITDSKGKLTAYAKGLEQVGLSQQKLASDLRTGNIAAILASIKQAAGGNVVKEGTLVQAVFGTSGSAAAMAVLKDYNAYVKETVNLSGAGSGTLGTSFADALKQIGPQLNVLKANLNNLMINAGKLLLPAASDVIKWVAGFSSELNKNKVLRDTLGAGAAVLFAGALATKLAGLGLSLARAFGVEAASAELAGPIGLAIAAAVLGAIALNKIMPSSVKDQGQSARTEFNQNKLKGVADIATLFGNVGLSAVNYLTTKLPGKPALPYMALPFGPPTSSKPSGGVGTNYGVIAPKGKVYITNKHTIKGK